MTECKYCRMCKRITKQVPVRTIGSYQVMESYCNNCNETYIWYEHIAE